MKNIKISIFILLSSLTSQAQSCFETGFTGFAQAHLNTFVANNPNCDSTGTISLIGEDITDLSPLSNIKFINGDLRLLGVNIDNIEALSNLQTITGSLVIQNCKYITSLDALADASISTSVILQKNENLIDVGFLKHIDSLTSQLHITENDRIKEIHLDSLTHVLNIDIDQNDSLEIISGAHKLKHLNGNESLAGHLILTNRLLRSLDAFSNIEYIHGNFEIKSQLLNNTNDFDQLHTVDGYIAFNNLGYIERLPSFLSLTSIGNNLTIIASSKMQNLQGLNNLKSIGGFGFEAHLGIKDLSGLDSLSYIGGPVFINMKLNHNEVASFPELTHIEGRLTFSGSYFNNIGGFGKLKTVTRGFENRGTNVQTLSNFKSLTNVGRDIFMYIGEDLVNLDGLEKIEPSGVDSVYLGFPNIPNLDKTMDCANEFICEYIKLYPEYIKVVTNGIGCNSLQEVIEACTKLSSQNINEDLSNIRVYPNPTNGILNIEGLPSTNATYQILDITAKIIDEGIISNNKIFLNHMPPGIYFLRVPDSNFRYKFVLIQ